MGAVKGATGATSPDTPTSSETCAAPPKSSGDPWSVKDDHQESSGGLWGSITSLAAGVKNVVDEQIAVQTAALNSEQAKVSAQRKPVDEAGILPWSQAPGVVQVQILALSEDERPFRQDPPSQEIFEFDLNKNAAQAMAACEWDERLAQMRYRLVPNEVTDEHFWRNYFYRARLITEMPNLLQDVQEAPPEGEAAEAAESSSEPAQASGKEEGAPAAACEAEAGELRHSNEFISDDFASGDGGGDEFESEEWRKEMQAELGLDGLDDDVGGDWEGDLADELEDLQKEIEGDI